MQQVEKDYVKTQKYDAWMDLHEDFNDWDDAEIVARAKDEGVELEEGFL